MKSIAMLRDLRDLRRYAPSAPPHQVRWIASARRRCLASAPQRWHTSPARKSLHRVPLLLDPAFARRRARRRPGPRARASKVLSIGRLLASLG
jgi:hypothetical protein